MPNARSADNSANIRLLETILRRADLWTQGLMSATASIESRLLGATGFHITACLALAAFFFRAVETGQEAWVAIASIGAIGFGIGAIFGAMGLLAKPDYSCAGLFMEEEWKRFFDLSGQEEASGLRKMIDQVRTAQSRIQEANKKRTRALRNSIWSGVAGLSLLVLGAFFYVILCLVAR